MATQSWSTVVDHTSDAAFRAWGLELQTKLLAAGLVQASDTGQINWTTVVRAAVNADAGYAIYYLNDSLHGAAPIYIKFYYGTGGNTEKPRIRVEVGPSTNGSGTVTGVAKTSTVDVTMSSSIVSTTTAYQSFLCVTAGFFGIVHKYQAGNTLTPLFSFAVSRSVDAAGVPTATSALVAFYGTTSSSALSNQSLRFAATEKAFVFTTTGRMALVPGGEINSLVGADTQAYLCWMLTPQVQPVLPLCVNYLSEAVFGSTFSATLIGSTPHTYISMGPAFGKAWSSASTNDALFGLSMLWE